jgi:hypothetical protein
VNVRIKLALAVAVTATMAVAGTAALAGGGQQIRETLTGYEEVPAVSTAGSGTFEASVKPAGDAITYKLTYSALEGSVQQSHIHLGQRGVNGGISVFLCSNLGNGPAGTQACPLASPATVEGTLTAADVIGPTGQGITAGEFAELIAAIRAGVTYVNVHSTKWPGGELRSQLGRDNSGRGSDNR